MTRPTISVIGPGDEATPNDILDALSVGKVIAENNCVLLCGGRNTGVMNAASKGAKESGGLVIGILPTESNLNTSEFVDVPIYTGMGSARNNIIVLSSRVVVAVGIGAGTSSEISLALKAEKQVVLYKSDKFVVDYFKKLSPAIKYINSSEELDNYINTELG